MADFTLATGKIAQGGGSGGLQSQRLRAGGGTLVRPGYVNPNAANIDFQPANIPKFVEDQTSKGIEHFMSATAEATFKYQTRESKFYADRMALEFAQEASRGYNGYQDEDGNQVLGYTHSRGEESIPGYSNFEAGLNEKFNDMLSNAEPRVRQYALLQMQSYKNTFLGKAAQHRATELYKAEEDMRHVKQSAMEASFALDPESIYRVDPTGGNTKNGKAKFYDLFRTTKEADAAWQGSVVTVGRGIYLKEITRPLTATSVSGKAQESADRARTAKEKAAEYYKAISNTELTQFPEALVQSLKDLSGYDAKEQQAFNYAYNVDVRERERIVKDDFKIGQMELSMGLAKGTPMTRERVQALMTAGRLNPIIGANYIRAQFGDKDKLGSPDALIDWTNKLTDAAGANFIDEDGNSLMFSYWGDPDLGMASIRRLDALQDSLGQPEFRNNYKTLMDEAKNLLAGEDWEGSFFQKSDDEMVIQAGIWIGDALRNRVPVPEIRQTMDSMYRGKAEFTALERLPSAIGVYPLRPINDGQLKQSMHNNIVLHANKKISDLVYNNNLTTFSMYDRTFKGMIEIDRLKAEKEAKQR